MKRRATSRHREGSSIASSAPSAPRRLIHSALQKSGAIKSCRSRRLAAASTLVLAFGAGATPALAATTNSLASTIATAQTSAQFNFNENLHTSAGDHKALTALVTNAYRADRAVALVARTPATSFQRAAKAEWLKGERLEVTFDVQTAAGVIAILSGHKTAGWQEVNAAEKLTNRIDSLTAHADKALGAHPA